MQTPPFEIGNRVRTVRQLMLLPVGSVGTVRRIYRVRDLCAVDFDGWPDTRILAFSELEADRSAPQTSAVRA